MTRVQRTTLMAIAFMLTTLAATGALVAAGLNEDTVPQSPISETCVSPCL